MKQAATNTDWAVAMSLYLQGLGMTAIASQLGCNYATLKSRAVRERWIEKRANSRTASVQIVQNSAQNALQRIGERTRNKVADVTESLANDLSERKLPRSLEGANLFADTLAKTAKTAALVHGWENTTINAIVMAGDTTDAIESLCEGSIDVESVPSQPE